MYILSSWRCVQTEFDSNFVERNRRGRGVTSHVEAVRALTDFVDFMSENKDAFPSFDSVALIIRYRYLFRSAGTISQQ